MNYYVAHLAQYVAAAFAEHRRRGEVSVLRKVRDYLLALAVLGAVWGTYAMTLGRWLEPAAVPRRPLTASVLNEVSRRNPFAHLFQPGDWELAAPKVLETSQGTLLFQEYVPREAGKMEIRPCTLIVFSGAKETDESHQSARPIMLRATQGATLQFDGEVDFTRGKLGRLIGGRIQGDIRVFGPASQPGANDQLELITRNVQIDPRQLWTPHEVSFRYGPHFGSGSELTIGLLPADRLSGKKSQTTGFAGVEMLTLAQLKEIQLVPGESEVFPQTGLPAAPSSGAPVRITCDGPWRFDVARRLSTFEENVAVERTNPAGPPDRLRCNQLAIVLRANDESASGTSTDKASPAKNNAPIDRIVAIGTPVKLEAPSQQLSLEAERFEYDLAARQLLLKMLSSGARVKLKRGGEEFVAPELAYEMSATGQLGKLWAPGPGRLVSQTGSGDTARKFTAQWRREIRLRPQDATSVISLLDDARIQVDGQGDFRADELHLWLIDPPRATGEKAASMSSAQPDRLLALGRVHMESPQLVADIDRLETWFEHAPVERPPPTVAGVKARPASNGLVLNSASGVPVMPPPPPPVAPPIAEPPPSTPAEQSEEVARYQLLGEIVRLQVFVRGDVTELRNLSVEGKTVKVREMNAESEEEAFFLSGNRIDLEGGLNNAIVTVQGTPAVAAARGMSFRSAALTLNRRDNRFLVEQAGDMTLPVQAGLQGEQLAAPQTLNIAWQGSLLFDGLNAKIRKGVTVRGPGYTAAADLLLGKLSREISLRGGASTPADTELRSLQLQGHAKLENRGFAEDGSQLSLEKMEADSLDIDRRSGDVLAIGPGWLSSTRLGEAPTEKNAGRTVGWSPPAAKTELTYVRVEFRESLKGNMTRRQVEFRDQVQAVFGPVPHWDAEMSMQSLEALGDRGAMLAADELSIADFAPTRGQPGSLEMIAQGNTRVEGRDFHAFAHRLSYATSKSQLILEGDGRTDAKIRRRADNTYIEAQRVLYQRDTNAVQVDGSRVLTFGPLETAPNAPRPPSPRDVRSRQ